MGSRRFMDYLGYENGVDEPLLVVEAKRPTDFPIPANGSMETASALVAKWLADPTSAPGLWNKWLASSQGLCSISRTSHGSISSTTAITDGNWLLIFEQASGFFAKGGTPKPDHSCFHKRR